MLPVNQPIDREADAKADAKQEVAEAFAALNIAFTKNTGYADLCDKVNEFVAVIPDTAKYEAVEAIAKCLNGYCLSRDRATRQYVKQRALLECIETLLEIE